MAPVIGWIKTTFAALAIRDYRVLWIAGLASFVAFFMAMIVQSVVAFGIAGNNRAVGTVVAAQGVAMATLGTIGGAFADRWPKRRVIAISQSATALTFTTLAFLVATERITVPLLGIAALLIGGTLAFLGPARMAMIVDLVPFERRGNAMAISNIANTAARVAGPALAGVLLAWKASGAVGAYLTMAGLYAGSALSLLLLPRSQVRADARDKPVFADVAAGLRYVAGHRRLRLQMIFYVTVILSGFPHVTILPGLVENVFGRDAAGVSVLFATSATGALCASLAVARFGDSPQAHVVYSALAALFGAGLLGVAFAPSLRAVTVAMFFVGAGSGGFQSLNAAVIARQTEPAYIGRVMSLAILAFAGFGLMALPYGLLADWIGEQQTVLAMSGVVLTLCVLLGIPLARQEPVEAPDGEVAAAVIIAGSADPPA